MGSEMCIRDRAEIVGKPDVDGGLVGGASLVGDEFAKLAANASTAV